MHPEGTPGGAQDRTLLSVTLGDGTDTDTAPPTSSLKVEEVSAKRTIFLVTVCGDGRSVDRECHYCVWPSTRLQAGEHHNV